MPGAERREKGNAACLAETLLAGTVVDASPKLTCEANPLYPYVAGDRGPPHMRCSRPPRRRHILACGAPVLLAELHPHWARTAPCGNTGVCHLVPPPSCFPLISASRMEHGYDNRSRET
jgi:hypothetical protein